MLVRLCADFVGFVCACVVNWSPSEVDGVRLFRSFIFCVYVCARACVGFFPSATVWPQGSDYYEYAQGFQSHIAGVLKAALGKVTMTPSEREERRLRRLAALANHTAGSDVDSSESEEEAAPSSPEAPPAAAQQRPGRRSRGGT